MTDYQTTPGYPTTPRYPATPEQSTTAFATSDGAPASESVGDTSGQDASVKDKAAESAQAGKQAAGDVAHTAAAHGKEVAAEAQKQARNLVSEAGSQLQDHARDQHRNAVSNLRSLGDELQSMAQNGEQDGPASQLVRQAADRTHAAANWLDGRQPQDVLGELSSFARRRPGAFLLGALAAGVVAGRLTRGTIAAHQDDGASTGNGSAPQPSPTTTGDCVPSMAAPRPATPETSLDSAVPGGLA